MASLRPVRVPCPECEEPIEVTFDDSSELVDGALVVIFQPRLDRMAEHYAREHAGTEPALD
jgi:hypothetical protein